jgi:hypothetical protein
MLAWPGIRRALVNYALKLSQEAAEPTWTGFAVANPKAL